MLTSLERFYRGVCHECGAEIVPVTERREACCMCGRAPGEWRRQMWITARAAPVHFLARLFRV